MWSESCRQKDYAEEQMDMMGLKKTIDRLAIANGVS